MPSDNPFQKIDLAYEAKTTRLFKYDDLQKFVATANAPCEHLIGTAAMIAFFWLQREIDIIGRLTWSHYRLSDAPHVARIIHHKTGEVVDLDYGDSALNSGECFVHCHRNVLSFEAGKTNGLFIRFSLKLPLSALVMVRMLLGF